MSENRCVMCGDIIPEGRMVCPACENKVIDPKAWKEARKWMSAKWICKTIEKPPEIKNGYVYRNEIPTFECSNYHTEFAGIKDGFNYCPHCGFPMDEGE